MDQRDWFIVGARLMGLWTLITVVYEFRVIVAGLLGLWRSETTSAGSYVLAAIVSAVVGYYLLCHADSLANFVYPASRPQPPDAADEVAPPEEPQKEEDEIAPPGKPDDGMGTAGDPKS
jgi:hypothetical protein